MSEAFERLSQGGRLAIITFHSIEDRIVKIHSENIAQAVPVRRIFLFAYAEKPRGRTVYRKPITASEEELAVNNRSRSAKLRVIEKL